MTLHDRSEERPRELALYFLEHKSTVRATAAAFGISKSTVHKDVTERLERMDPRLAGEVRELLGINKSERHIRGGNATRLKYQMCPKKHRAKTTKKKS